MNNDFSVAFWIGPIPIPWYGLMLTIGFLLTILFCYYEWRKKELSSFEFYLLVSVGGVVAVFGARIWYLIFNPSDFESIISIFQISSGRSILGSIFFGIIWIIYFNKRMGHKIETRFLFSLIIPNVLLGQAIGRWGNFFQQDVYGQIVTKEQISFLPEFIIQHMYIDGQYRQPLFLYESIINLLGWIFITFLIKNLSYFKPGTHFSFYFIWYGASRGIMELFRDDKFIMKIGGFPTSFFLSIIFLFFGIISFIYYQFFFETFTTWKKFNSKIELNKNKNLFLNKMNFLFKKNITKEMFNENKILIKENYKKEIRKINLKNKEIFKSNLNKTYQ